MSNARPNILLIMTDQQRGDCLGLDPAGPSCLQTPNLDWIGRTGINIATRLMGLMLSALAVEFIVNGLRALLPALR